MSNYRTLLFSATGYGTSAATLSESRFNYDALLYEVGLQGAADGLQYFMLPNSAANNINFQFGYGGGTNEYLAHSYGTWSDATHLSMTKGKAIMLPLTAVSCTGTSAHEVAVRNCIYKIWGVNNISGIDTRDKYVTIGEATGLMPYNETLLYSSTNAVSSFTLNEPRNNYERLKIRVGNANDSTYFQEFGTETNAMHINFPNGQGGAAYWRGTYGTWNNNMFSVQKTKRIRVAYNNNGVSGDQYSTAGFNCIYEVWGVNRK